jgi:hypothetical protein
MLSIELKQWTMMRVLMPNAIQENGRSAGALRRYPTTSAARRHPRI